MTKVQKEKLDNLWEQVMKKSVEMYLENSGFSVQMRQIEDEEIKEKIKIKHDKIMNSLASEWANIKGDIISTIKG